MEDALGIYEFLGTRAGKTRQNECPHIRCKEKSHQGPCGATLGAATTVNATDADLSEASRGLRGCRTGASVPKATRKFADQELVDRVPRKPWSEADLLNVGAAADRMRMTTARLCGQLKRSWLGWSQLVHALGSTSLWPNWGWGLFVQLFPSCQDCVSGTRYPG
ncbi:hypothetical protein L1887_53942 [Cichorium endivia]|nr:hypothetical protein L1887_53942 [Cichorium endivia]